MKKIITFLFATVITVTAFGQTQKTIFKSGYKTKDTAGKEITMRYQSTDSVKENTPLLPVSDLTAFSNYLKDKLLARDYEIVMAAINELYGRRIKEFYEKQKVK